MQNNKIQTGNNVGKTTVLKLIDVCFGANQNIVYKDSEDKNKEYITVKNFLIENNIAISLKLGNSFETTKDNIIIQRNFLSRNKAIRKINNNDILDKDFKTKLLNIFFPEILYSKPTFRQIISHYNRYTDRKISNTLKTLDSYKNLAEYETLYLFMLGCDVSDGENRQLLLEKLKQEENYKKWKLSTHVSNCTKKSSNNYR